MNRRSFSKLSLLAIGGLVGCKNSLKIPKDHARPLIIPAPILDLEKLIHRKYGFNQTSAWKNNQYLIDNIKNKPELVKKVTNNNFNCNLEGEIEDLEKTEHNKGFPGITYAHVQAFEANQNFVKLNLRQSARIQVLLDSLKKPEFRRQIWTEIQTDLKDPQVEAGYFASEYGGLIKFHNKELDVFRVPSIMSTTNSEFIKKLRGKEEIFNSTTNTSYAMLEKILKEEGHIFQYHLHAINEDCSKSAGPSFGFGPTGFNGDIGNALYFIRKTGETHQVVITKLKGNKFNVGYYGGEKEKGERMKDVNIAVVNLGDWSS